MTALRLALAGSRNLDARLVEDLIIPLVPRILGGRQLAALGTGDAKGADEGARRFMAWWLFGYDPDLTCRVYSAAGDWRPPGTPKQAKVIVCSDWRGPEKLGAGPIRNGRLIADHDELVLVWDGRSRGSADVLAKARAKRMNVHELILRSGGGA